MASHADRYTYIPFLGLFILIGIGLTKIPSKKLAIGTYILTCVWICCLTVKTNLQTHYWQNDETLWTNVIDHYPDSYFAWANRGYYYFKNGNNDLAKSDYEKCVELEPRFFMAHNNLGLIYSGKEEHRLAIDSFTKTLTYKQYEKAYLNRALEYQRIGESDSALTDFNAAISLDTAYALAFYNRGALHFKNQEIESSLTDFKKAIKYGFDHSLLRMMKYKLEWVSNNVKQAYIDCEACLEMDPNNTECIKDFDQLKSLSNHEL